jgi:hypothetical protein
VKETVEWFGARPELQLVVRVHPAESRLKNLPTKERIADLFAELPKNVTLVPGESEVSSYTLMDMASAALVYATNAGMEAALRGKPAICAARAHYYGKGVACDAPTREAYFGAIERWRELKPDIAAARRYAYFFFFQYMVPFPYVHEFIRGDTTGRDFRFEFRDLRALAAEPPVDLRRVIDGIADGRPIYREG